MHARRTSAVLCALAAVSLAVPGCTADATSVDSSSPQQSSSDVASPDCADGAPLTQVFDNGAAWSMCWSIDPDLGLVLADIGFAPDGGDPIPVLESLSIAQLEVPYDNGERITNDITEAGFGSGRMQTLTEKECAGDRIATKVPNIGDGTYGKSPEREVLCSEVGDDGLGYRSSDGVLVADRRQSWKLGAISKVGWYEYVAQYAFGSDGTISPSLGATGDVSPLDFEDGEHADDHGWAVGEGDEAHAASHSHNAVWRMHWSLGAVGDLRAQQYDAKDTGEYGSESPIVDGSLVEFEHPTIAEKENRRWWRVLSPTVENSDGHPISYQIDLSRSDSFTFTEDQHEHGADAGYDVAFTNADDCQRFATHNDSTCGEGVLDYVEDGEDEPLRDVVSWVAVGFHHVVRDEDQSPMDTHWQGFTLLPRDLTAQRVGVPDGREDVNGVPEDSIWLQGEDDE